MADALAADTSGTQLLRLGLKILLVAAVDLGAIKVSGESPRMMPAKFGRTFGPTDFELRVGKVKALVELAGYPFRQNAVRKD